MRNSTLTRKTPLRPGKPPERHSWSKASRDLQGKRRPAGEALGRSGELRPSALETARPQRKAPIRRANPERLARLEKRNFGPHGEFVRKLPCLVPECGRPAERAHLRPRGMGGCKGDWRELINLCAAHHRGARGQEGRTAAFEAEHRLSLAAARDVLIVADPWPNEADKQAALHRLADLQPNLPFSLDFAVRGLSTDLLRAWKTYLTSAG